MLTKTEKIKRLDKYLGEITQDIDQEFYKIVIKENLGKEFKDVRAWCGYAGEQIKAMWWIFVRRN
jgi:hypothetical protein